MGGRNLVLAFGALAVGSALLVSCAGSQPTIQTGPNAVKSPDGLNKVDNVLMGTLFMKTDYAFGSYHQFALGRTVVTFKQGSRVLDENELNELKSIFEGVAREAIARTGRTEAEKPDRCVALVNLALVDLDLVAADGAGASSLGAVTLVMEIRDGRTREPLLRYGQRRRLEGGAGLGTSLRRYAAKFQRDFNRSLPPPETIAERLDCQERGGEISSSR